MKTFAFASVLSAACAAVAFAAIPELPDVNQLQIFPKNLARQHYGVNLTVFDKTASKYVPTEAAAAWLDEDAVTGWPALAGKQHYLLQLSESQMITNFSLSSKNSNGTVSLFTSEQALAPEDPGWTQVAKEVPIEALNQKQFVRALNRTAKFVLIETDIADPAPIYSLYVYGEKAAASESIIGRPQPLPGLHAIGEFVNQQTAFNVAGLYANARVTYVNTAGSNIAWQRAIDDNPETALPIAPSTEESGAVVRFTGSQPISRLSILGDAAAQGTMDIFLLSKAPEVNQAVGLQGVAPSASIKFDGAAGRGSADVAETNAVAMVVRWTPEDGASAFNLRELSAFANIPLTEYQVGPAPAMVAAGPGDVGTMGEGKEGKDIIASGPGKDFKDPIAAGPLDAIAAPPGQGFAPGRLGFPPRTLLNPVSE